MTHENDGGLLARKLNASQRERESDCCCDFAKPDIYNINKSYCSQTRVYTAAAAAAAGSGAKQQARANISQVVEEQRLTAETVAAHQRRMGMKLFLSFSLSFCLDFS
jgi:hypothetical protein